MGTTPEPEPKAPISFALPNEVGRMIRNLPLRGEKWPDEYLALLEKTKARLGPELHAEIKSTNLPMIRSVLASLPEGATHEDVWRRIYDMQWAITQNDPALSATIQIYFWGNDRKDPEAHGSGVLMNLGGDVFLFTAAHVLELHEQGDFFLAIGNRLRRLNGSYFFAPVPPSGDRKDDRLDVAYWHFDDPEIIREFADTQPMVHRKNAIINEPHGRCFRIAGYPFSKTEMRGNEIVANRNSDEGFEIEANEYQRLGISQETNIAVKVNRKRMFSPALARTVTPPSPVGMSGGGMYLETALNEPPFIQFMLAGIVTDFHPDEWLLIGTRLPGFLRILFANRPELAERATDWII